MTRTNARRLKVLIATGASVIVAAKICFSWADRVVEIVNLPEKVKVHDVQLSEIHETLAGIRSDMRLVIYCLQQIDQRLGIPPVETNAVMKASLPSWMAYQFGE